MLPTILLIHSDCEEKVKYIINEQRPVLFNYYEQTKPGPGFINMTVFMTEKNMMRIGCQTELEGLKSINCSDHPEFKSSRLLCRDNDKEIADLLETHSRREPIRFLSATDIEILGDKKGTGMHLTRIPLSSLQERIHANDTEMDFIISKLGLADAMQKSIALVHCHTLTDTTLCDTDEFKPETAKRQLNADKPETNTPEAPKQQAVEIINPDAAQKRNPRLHSNRR